MARASGSAHLMRTGQDRVGRGARSWPSSTPRAQPASPRRMGACRLPGRTVTDGPAAAAPPSPPVGSSRARSAAAVNSGEALPLVCARTRRRMPHGQGVIGRWRRSARFSSVPSTKARPRHPDRYDLTDTRHSLTQRGRSVVLVGRHRGSKMLGGSVSPASSRAIWRPPWMEGKKPTPLQPRL